MSNVSMINGHIDKPKNETERDRLAEIYHNIEIEYLDYLTNIADRALNDDIEDKIQKRQDFYVDKLLANGVIVPPVKVGDTVYVEPKTWRSAYLWINYPHTFFKGKHYIVADVVSIVKTRKQTLMKLGTYNQTTFTREYERYPISAIGKTVFPTREEAEAKLKGGVE